MRTFSLPGGFTRPLGYNAGFEPTYDGKVQWEASATGFHQQGIVDTEEEAISAINKAIESDQVANNGVTR